MKNVFKEKSTFTDNQNNFLPKIVSCFLVAGMLSGCAGSPASEGKGIWGVIIPEKKQGEGERKIDKNADKNSESIYGGNPGMERLSRQRAAETQRLIFSDKPWG